MLEIELAKAQATINEYHRISRQQAKCYEETMTFIRNRHKLECEELLNRMQVQYDAQVAAIAEASKLKSENKQLKLENNLLLARLGETTGQVVYVETERPLTLTEL